MRRISPLIAVLGGLAVSSLPVGAAVAGTSDSGISGQIQEGPTCPVEHPGSQCAPKPLSAKVRIHPVGERSPVVTVRSDRHGQFLVTLAPGNYVVRPLRVRNHPYPNPPPPSRVQVVAGQFTQVTITYDTGIR